jgi:hypothetical protein
MNSVISLLVASICSFVTSCAICKKAYDEYVLRSRNNVCNCAPNVPHATTAE